MMALCSRLRVFFLFALSAIARDEKSCAADEDTDVTVKRLPFVKAHIDEITTGQSLPGIISLLYARFAADKSLEHRDITVLDARKLPALTYERQGFTLVPLNSRVNDFTTGQEEYKRELEVMLRKLHPKAKKIAFTNFVFRGGRGQTSPATNSPHLDNFQNLDEVLDFAGARDGGTFMREEVATMRDGNVDGYSPRLLLGVWKPIQMQSPVCDFPLMLLDASTFQQNEQVRNRQHFSHIVGGKRIQVQNLAAHLKYNETQQWYYFHGQRTDEVTVFRHFSFDGEFYANVHSSFKNPNCPRGSIALQLEVLTQSVCADYLYYLERACMFQVLALQAVGGDSNRLSRIDEETCRSTVAQKDKRVDKQARLHMDSILRILHKEEPDFAS